MKVEKRKIALVAFLAVIILYSNALYYRPASDIAKYSGTVLTDNWWTALNWIRNNTVECSVVATYLGHPANIIKKKKKKKKTD